MIAAIKSASAPRLRANFLRRKWMGRNLQPTVSRTVTPEYLMASRLTSAVHPVAAVGGDVDFAVIFRK